MTRWESNNPYVNIDLNITNITLNGDWPNMTFSFSGNFNYYCPSGWANMYYDGVNFNTQVTGYDTRSKSDNVNFSLNAGQASSHYGDFIYTPSMGNSKKRTVDIHGWISNGIFTGGGWTTVSSPQVAPPTAFSISSVTNIKENSVTVSHVLSNIRNYWYVKLYDELSGTFWNLNTSNGNGTTTITGLKPNQTYRFRLRVYGRDGSYHAQSTSGVIKDITTLGKSSIGTTVSYTVGKSLLLTINGFSDHFTHTAIFKIGGYTFSRTGLKRGKVTITPTAAENNSMYMQMSTVTTKAISLTLTTFNNDTNIGSDTGSGTVLIDQSVCAPVVNSFLYKDTNTITKALTGNDQMIIQNASKIQVYDMKATAKNGAAINKYRLDISGNTYESSTAVINTNVITKNTAITLKTFDSRGIQGLLSKSFIYIPYDKPLISHFSITRKNLVEPSSILELTASYSLIKINSVNKNAIQSVKYRYKETTASTWGSFATIICTLDDTNSNIRFDNVIGDFDINKSYNFEIQITDKLSSSTLQSILLAGKPTLSLRKSSLGINKVPITGRALDVDGDIYAKNIKIINKTELDTAMKTKQDVLTRGTLTVSADTMYTAGCYWCRFPDIDGTPYTTGYGWLEIIKSNNTDVCIQKIYRFGATGISAVAFRTYINDKWYPWRMISTVEF